VLNVICPIRKHFCESVYNCTEFCFSRLLTIVVYIIFFLSPSLDFQCPKTEICVSPNSKNNFKMSYFCFRQTQLPCKTDSTYTVVVVYQTVWLLCRNIFYCTIRSVTKTDLKIGETVAWATSKIYKHWVLKVLRDMHFVVKMCCEFLWMRTLLNFSWHFFPLLKIDITQIFFLFVKELPPWNF
jgi:hypothetical protein